MDPQIMKSTQDSLGKIIKKPPLTDKLLSKPPFRFLHDIMTSVIKTTGFMKGLYTESEMNSENVKDKDGKMAFLQKAVDMVSLVLGVQLSVRPSKVVAGHEPEKTNEFLQALAAAINKNVNSDDYVQRVLNGDKGSKSKDEKKERKSREKGDKEEKKSRERSSDKRKEEKDSQEKEERRERSRDKDRGREEKDKHRDKDRDKEKHQEKDKDREREKKRDKDRDGEKDREKDRSKDTEKNGEKDKDRHKDRDHKDREREHKSKKEDESPSSPGASFDRTIGIKSRLKSRPSEENVDMVTSTEVERSSSGSHQKLNESPAKRHSSGTKLDLRNSRSNLYQKDRRANLPHQNASSKDKGKKKTSSSTDKDAKPSNDLLGEAVKADNVSSAAKVDGMQKKPINMLMTEQNQPLKEHRREEAQKENESPELETPTINGETGETADPPTKRAERPTSAKGSRRRRDEDIPSNQLKQESTGGGALGEDDLPPQVAEARKLARPSSARPAAPRVKNKDALTDEPAMRLGSGKPTNVILDNDQSDDDDNFMVEESAPPPLPLEREKTMLGVENDEEHGGLVKKILESKKEFEGGNQQTSAPQKKVEIERPTMSDAARRKEREMVQKEIDKLRGSIQTVTRSANPLGKIMDYVQEDLDAMQKELDMWKKENKEQSLALKREQSITDKAIEPLKAQLSEIDQAIVDQMDLIAAVKSNIISNDQKIEKMLRSISKS
ncbi:TRAF3-interacting protein 1-like isoform X2 [Liolophura sinensis]|uniref:TRAF3-interacting protein 1-like isoform X2 n=1 Tax=Liolophura sinensis TaxID=3198878 RepID=UPI00315931EC